MNLDPADATAFHCKIVALIQAGKVQDCLKQVANSKFELSLQFEVAYCHYRNNDLHKALEVLDTVTNPGLKHNELRAQVLYKLEQFEKWFLNINPDAAVPVMMYKGKPYLESRDIAQFAIRNISTQHKLLISDDVIVSQYMKMYDGFSNLF